MMCKFLETVNLYPENIASHLLYVSSTEISSGGSLNSEMHLKYFTLHILV